MKMARLGVTYQDVANTAEQLLGQGKQPTIELIRNQLGTGSTTTIAYHLRKWRAEQDGSTSVAIKENLPQEYVSLMKGLWQRLLADADKRVTSNKQESEQRIANLQQEVEKYKTNNQRWQKMHDAWVKEKEGFARDKLRDEQVILSHQKENTGLLAKLEAQQNQFDEKHQRIEELNRLHKLAQENLEHFRESMCVQRLIEQEKHAQQLQQLEVNLKNADQQLVAATQDKITLQRQLEKTVSDIAKLQEVNEAINQQSNTIRTLYSTLEKEHIETQRDAMHYQKQYEQLLKKLEEQSALLIEHQHKHAISAQQLSVACDEVKELKEMNKMLAREKWEIAQEKAHIEGVNMQMQKMIQLKEVC